MHRTFFGKLAALVLLLAVSLSASAQADVSITLPEDVYSYRLIDGQPYLYFETRKSNSKGYKPNGTFGVIDTRTGQLLWEKKRNYVDDIIEPTRCGVARSNPTTIIGQPNTKLLAFATGEKERTLPILATYYDWANDLLMGYDLSENGRVNCYRLTADSLLWHTVVASRDHVWRGLEPMGGNHILFKASQMVRLNLLTGGQNILMVTDKQIANPAVTANAMGSMFGLMGGLLSYALSPKATTVGPVGTGMCWDAAGVAAADRETLNCMDSEFSPLWTVSLNKKLTSQMRVTANADTVFVLNSGFVADYGVAKKVGKPFYAAYRRATGEQIYLDMLSEKWDKALYGKYLNFAPDSLYYLADGHPTFRVVTRQGQSYPVWRMDGDVAMVNAQLQEQARYELNRLYEVADAGEGYRVLRQMGDQSDFYVLNAEGRCVQHYGSDCTQVKLSGGQVLVTRGRTLTMEKL